MKKISVLLSTLLAICLMFGCSASERGGATGANGEVVSSGGGNLTGSSSDKMELSGYKEDYTLGENFSSDGLTVKYNLGDGEQTANADDYILDSSDFDSSKPGKYDIKVYLKNYDLDATYQATVRRAKPAGEPLRILAIGNSFSQDAVKHLYKIAEDPAVGVELSVGNLVIGGCPLERHANNIRDNIRGYTYETFKKVNGEFKENSRSGWSIKAALFAEDWDIISIQQVSGLSGMIDTYNEDLDYIVEYLRTNKPDAEIVWHMTWAYAQSSSHGDFSKYNKDQMTMYNKIVECAKKRILPFPEISRVTPSGTAIQNLRTSFIGDTLNRDGYHLKYNIGRYTAGMTWLKCLTGWDIDDVEYTPVIKDQPDITPKQLVAIKEAVNNAFYKPFEVTESIYKTE